MGQKRRAEPADGSAIKRETILAIVHEMRASNAPPKDKKRIFGRLYSEFAEACPRLFEMAASEDFDLERLEYMLKLRDEVQANTLSHAAASQQVAQTLTDVYVTPVITPDAK